MSNNNQLSVKLRKIVQYNNTRTKLFAFFSANLIKLFETILPKCLQFMLKFGQYRLKYRQTVDKQL